MPARRKYGRNANATTTSVIAAIHSYEAMASPTFDAAFPLIPTNCSVEMLAAMSENPMSHHVRSRPARK